MIRVVLNDKETYGEIAGVVIIDNHGLAFDLLHIWRGAPQSVIMGALIGPAEKIVPKVLEDDAWP